MPTPTRRIARRLTALGLAVGLAAVLVSTAIASGADGSWNLSKPGVSLSPNNVLGDAPRGLVFQVSADTPVSAFGIDAAFDDATTLTVELRTVTGRTPPDGPPVTSGSLRVGRGGMAFHDVLVTPVTLFAGQVYDVRFQVTGGWGVMGPNSINQQDLDPDHDFNSDFNSSNFFTPDPPFTVIAAGGGFGPVPYTYATASLPHVHVIGAALDSDSPTIDVKASSGDERASTGWYNASSSGTDGVVLEVSVHDVSPLRSVVCNDGTREVLDTTNTVSTIELRDGFHSITCTAVDAYGNPASSPPLSVRVDQQPPTLAPVVNPNPVREGQFAEAFPKATDNFDVADSACEPVSTTQVGRHSVRCRAEDAAGNEATAEVDYDVEYAFEGFFSPVRMNGTNQAKAGSSVPLKFSIGEYDGLDILAGGSPSVQRCGGGDATSAEGRLSYDADAGQYVYVWKTDRAWAGTCRAITVRLDDGSAKSVSFRMT